MLKYASLLTPLLFRASAGTQNRMSLANLVLAYAFIFFGGIFGLVALYIWAASELGTLAACVIVCGAMMSSGALILLAKREPKLEKHDVPEKIRNDPLASYIPESLKNDPRVVQLLEKIAENPVAASAGGVTLGMIISRELMGD